MDAMSLQNIRIGHRMALAFAVLIGFLVAVAWIGMRELGAVNANVKVITHDRLVKVNLTHLIENEVNRQSRALRTAMLTNNASLNDSELKKIEESVPKVAGAIARLQETIKTPQGKEALAKMLEARQIFKAQEAVVIDLIKSHQLDKAREHLIDQVLPTQTVYLSSIEHLTQTQTDAIDAFAQEAELSAETGQFSMWALSLAAVVLATLIAWLTTRSITSPLEKLKFVLTKVENTSDFSLRLSDLGANEIGQTGKAFNRMLEVQQRAVDEVKMVVTALSLGDFSKRVEADLKGDLADMKQAVNQSSLQIQETMVAINRALASLQAGRFDVQVLGQGNGSASGDFKLALEQAQRAFTALRSIMEDVGKVMSGVAQGDLTARVQAQGNGALQALKDHLNTALNALGDALRMIGGNTQSLAVQANQTSQAMIQISNGAQSQTVSIEQVSVALNQAVNAITEVANNTESASRHSRNSVDLVRAGKEKMQRMVDVVNNIAENAQRINKISEVIESIAYKTNLLSLNAAIEAARAGEQGKGFAVVADEVGKLAINSAESTEEIKALVHQAGIEAKQAVETVAAVSEDMNHIEAGALSTDGMLQRISAAIEEQSNAMQEIDVNVRQVTRVANASSSAAEELTATANELARISEVNRMEVERFKF
jgi:methyl-accepting chemotaxis protein